MKRKPNINNEDATMKLLTIKPRLWRCYDQYGNVGEGINPSRALSAFKEDKKKYPPIMMDNTI